MATCRNVTTYDALIRSAASAYAVPVALVKAIMSQESDFNPRAYNPEGTGTNPSAGLMQVRLSTARGLGYPGELGNRDALTGLYAPGVNVPLAAKLLSQNYTQARGNWDVAISAYNAGFSPTRTWDAKRDSSGNIVNAAYVRNVRQCWTAYEPQIGGTPPPVTVDTTGVMTGGGVATKIPPATLAGIIGAALSLLVWYLTRK